MEQVRMRTVETRSQKNKGGFLSTMFFPVVALVVTVFCLFWAVDHIAGGCTTWQDITTYCPLS